MSNVSKGQLMIGLPSSGKTSYLAALWHVVAYASHHIEGALKLHSLEGGDKEYLNNICDRWVSALPLDRTKISSEQFVTMILKDPLSGNVVRLDFPDLSGESFDQQWSERQTTTEYAEIVENSTGFLLLIHPEMVKPEALIQDANAIIDVINVPVNGPKNQNTPKTDFDKREGEGWNSKNTPTQIKLVELLQFLSVLKNDEPLNLAIIVSAWDKIRIEKNPEKWIKGNLPLLYQYIESNNNSIKRKYFGISAQGDDYKNKLSLLECPTPEKRIKVVIADSSNVTNDISLPVRWLMEI